MKTYQEFKQHFEENVKANLEGLEARRAKMYLWRMRLGGIAGGIIFLNWAAIYLIEVHPYTIIFTLLVAPPVCYFIYVKHFIDHAIPDEYKAQVVKEMLAFLDGSLTYEATSFIAYEDFLASELFLLQPDHYGGDDKITGTIDGVPLQLSEVQVMYEAKDKPRTSGLIQPKKPKWKTVFHGVFLIADYPGDFKGKLFIFPDRLQKNLDYLGMLIQMHNLVLGKYIKPRNMEFRENFSVYAQKEREGERLLTNELMERLLELKKLTKSEIYMSLIGNKIYVGLDMRRELFKVDTTRPLFNPYFVRSFYDEMLSLFMIIDVLNIDEMELPTEQNENAGQEEEKENMEMKVLKKIAQFGQWWNKINKRKQS